MKRVEYGWIENLASYHRDYHSSEVGKKRRDETLDNFQFTPDVIPDRSRLRLPLIFPKKKAWETRAVRKVKVTIEYV